MQVFSSWFHVFDCVKFETDVDVSVWFSQHQLQICFGLWMTWSSKIMRLCPWFLLKGMLAKRLLCSRKCFRALLKLSQQFAPILVIVCQDSGQNKSNFHQNHHNHIQRVYKAPQFCREPSFLTHIYAMNIVFYLTKISNKVWKILGQLGSADPRVDNMLPCLLFCWKTCHIPQVSRIISWDLQSAVFGQACSDTNATRSLGWIDWKGMVGMVRKNRGRAV